MTRRIPLEYVEGPNEVTVWLWPDSPDPLTVRFDTDEWNRLLEKLEASDYEDLETMVGTVVLEDIKSA